MYKFLLVLCGISLSYCEIHNLFATKSVDLHNQLVKTLITITVRNDGNAQVVNYTYLPDPDVEKLSAQFFDHETGNDLKYLRRESNYDVVCEFVVIFDRAINYNETYAFLAEHVHYNKIISVYKKYNAEDHVVSYEGNSAFYSLYSTGLFASWYTGKFSQLLESSGEFVQKNQSYFYQESRHVKPLAYHHARFIYIDNDPWYFVTNLQRKIVISHFGFISVEDKVSVVNKGPKHVGPYQPAAHLRRSSILYAYLPAMSSNIKLFDELGNNSKSNFISRENYTSLVFETRYPMKRSWKSAYTLQYSVPSYTYLNSNGSHYSLIMKVVDHVIQDAVIENVEVKILLPEGSEIVDIKHPAVWERQGIKFLQDNLANSKPTIVLTANYLSDDDLVDFNVVYKRSMIHLFRPVLYVSAYIETVFLVCIFFRRLKL